MEDHTYQVVSKLNDFSQHTRHERDEPLTRMSNDKISRVGYVSEITIKGDDSGRVYIYPSIHHPTYERLTMSEEWGILYEYIKSVYSHDALPDDMSEIVDINIKHMIMTYEDTELQCIDTMKDIVERIFDMMKYQNDGDISKYKVLIA